MPTGLTEVMILTFLIGVVAGLRAMTAPAAVTWAAQGNWLHLQDTPLAFMGSTAALVVFTLLAVGELVGDQLPSTPKRTAPLGLIGRILTGGLCGAALAAAAKQPMWLGTLAGMAGGVAGAFGGYEARTRLVAALRVPDFVIASLEDVVAIGGAIFLVSRF